MGSAVRGVNREERRDWVLVSSGKRTEDRRTRTTGNQGAGKKELMETNSV